MGLLKQGKTGLLTGHVSRLAVVAMFGWSTVAWPVLAQTPPAPAQAPPAQPAAPAAVYSMSDLEYLLGPIALYPDPLLALILQASTFPQQIVDADNWILANPRAVEQNDFSAVDAMDWDSSVKALTRFPDVIELLADHLDWTQSLGMASAMQPQDVAAAVQLLRAKAESVGNLKSTPEQVVTVREDSGTRVIYIAPANPERIYVPIYDTSTVFFNPLPGAFAFSTGIVVGAAWNNRWGWNNRGWNQIWIAPPVWHPPPPNWNPQRPGRPGTRPPPGAWRPDRPGVRPERPPGVRPDRPGMRPDRPGVRPDRPGTRPDRPGARPDRPGARPDRPGTRPDRPGARPDRPGARPDRPAARPERPAARPQRPAARPERPAARPAERPAARPSRPAAGRPAQQARPPQQRARPQQARPQQQRARPQPQARPQQQRARPQQARPQQQQRARPQGQRTPR